MGARASLSDPAPKATGRWAARALLAGVALLPAALATAPTALADRNEWSPGPERYDVAETQNVAIPMRDGVEIRANVLRPADPRSGEPARGRFPVVINFTPYGKAALSGTGAAPIQGDAAGLARPLPELVGRGYINVIADIRGTGTSSGRFGLLDPVQGRDGAELVRWAARLPGSSGRVGMYGPSYMGIIQYLTAARLGRRSPLRALFPVAVPNDPYRELFVAGGMLSVLSDVPLLAVYAVLPLIWPVLEEAPADPLNAVQLLLDRADSNLSELLPLAIEVASGGERSYRGDFWRNRSPDSALRSVVRSRIPVMSVGGWADIFQRGSLMNWAGLQNAAHRRAPGAMPRPRERRRAAFHVVQGPWNHLNSGEGFPIAELAHRWFDHHLKGRRQPELSDPRRTLHLHDMTTERWRDVSSYPVPGARVRTLSLDGGPSGSGAPSPNDGRLTARGRVGSGADSIAFTGLSSPCGAHADQYALGALTLAFSFMGSDVPCNVDDTTTQLGPGALTYTTEPVRRATTIAGPMTASLLVRSNRPETYLVASVQDVAPDGSSRPLSQGALLGTFRAVDERRTWRTGDGTTLLPHHRYTRDSRARIVPGEPARMEIEIFPAMATLAPGHRLRLTLRTIDTPHVLPNASQFVELVGGVYAVERGGASTLNVPMAPARAVGGPCRICRALGN